VPQSLALDKEADCCGAAFTSRYAPNAGRVRSTAGEVRGIAAAPQPVERDINGSLLLARSSRRRAPPVPSHVWMFDRLAV
jgi:hypothetical protein